jgi:hypothetical protein
MSSMRSSVEKIPCVLELTIVVVVEKHLYFSRRSNDLSVDLSSTFTSSLPRVAVDGSIDLSVELAHVFSVEDGYFIALVHGYWKVLVIARGSIVGVFEFYESFMHSCGVSRSPPLFRDGINHSLHYKTV